MRKRQMGLTVPLVALVVACLIAQYSPAENKRSTIPQKEIILVPNGSVEIPDATKKLADPANSTKPLKINNSALSVQSGIPCQAPCIAIDAVGAGTVALPAPCPFITVDGTLDIYDGFPSGSHVDSKGTLQNFVSILQSPGGDLSGGFSNFQAQLVMQMQGAGLFSSYTRTLTIPISNARIDNAPRVPFTTPQSFASEFFQIQGQITADPDFDLLRITAGNFFGMPSPGHTTLTNLSATNWEVDSYFDLTYRLDFIGHSPGPFAGMSGSTTGTTRISNAGHHFWVSGDPFKMHFPQLPNPAGWDVYAVNPMVLADDWQCSSTGPIKDIHFWGSWLNDNVVPIDSFNLFIAADVPAGFDATYSHPGTVLWRRNINNWCEKVFTPTSLEGWYNPSNGGFIANNHNNYYQYDVALDSVDWFSQTSGTIYWLGIRAYINDPFGGARWGWKSTLNHFHDDACWLSIIPGSCVVTDNGTGTADLPAGCPYFSEGTFDITNGLPIASTLNSSGKLYGFFGVSRSPGGPLGGESEQYQGLLDFQMLGTGAYTGYSRSFTFPITTGRMDHAPRVLSTPVQSMANDMNMMSGQIPPGDPDFDLLRISAGTAFGMPSPGHTTLTQLPTTQWNSDSYFDLIYRIDFVGHNPGLFAGRSGSSTGTVRIHQGTSIGASNWIDIHEPPTLAQSLDLAFVVNDGSTSSPCTCTPGNANGDGTINISDAVYLISYIFASGPAPTPFATCSGDANCDCTVNISDAVFLIAYIFAGGPAPCNCTAWSSSCGAP